MTYEEFKELILQRMQQLTLEEYPNFRVEIESRPSVNSNDETICFWNTDEGATSSPRIHLPEMYRMVENYPFEMVVRRMEQTARAAIEESKQVSSDIIQREAAPQRIFFQLINTEQNKELLATLPHRNLQDLSLIYRYQVELNGDVTASTVINQPLAEYLQLDEDSLYEIALTNTRNLFTPAVIPMAHMMEHLLPDVALENLQQYSMYVITNESGSFGAANVVYSDILDELAKKCDSNLYIIPSSLHELIAVSEKEVDLKTLENMVYEVNATQLCQKERLSNQIYYYDKETQEFSMATNSPHVRLDDEYYAMNPPQDMEACDEEMEEGLQMGM